LCFQAEDGIRADKVTGVQTCALPISARILRSSFCLSDSLITAPSRAIFSSALRKASCVLAITLSRGANSFCNFLRDFSACGASSITRGALTKPIFNSAALDCRCNQKTGQHNKQTNIELVYCIHESLIAPSRVRLYIKQYVHFVLSN